MPISMGRGFIDSTPIVCLFGSATERVVAASPQRWLQQCCTLWPRLQVDKAQRVLNFHPPVTAETST